ncbi:MAG: carbamoyl phosphate synthase small subunit, partial [Gallicola sp.]|nr:carbamoyl phosphate synthase small subunit [Gallicola sp.]
RVTVMPHDSSCEDVLAKKPDGIFLANGPGNPKACANEIHEIRKMLEANCPIFAICLGHQLLALALGATTEKMKFGHRGENHPVRRLSDNKLFITSQNHGYVVNRESLEKMGLEVTYESVHDQTVEGMRLLGKNVSSVQFHPEANPGPEDTEFLFKEFVESLN